MDSSIVEALKAHIDSAMQRNVNPVKDVLLEYARR